MKKIYTLISFAFIALFANATTYTITVQNFSFTPQTIPNVVCNDVIVWQWVSGTHTTTSLSVPAGAATWDAPITSASPTYSYVVTVAGNYGYKCTPHFASMNMVGGFAATCTNAVPSIDNNYLTVAYPNPFSNKITIDIPDADMITLYNMVGEKIKSVALQHGQTKAEINASELHDGIYFYCIIKEGVVIETRKIVKN
jgi:plastocyanin